MCPARWCTPACPGAGSSLLTSGPWQTELTVPLSLNVALTIRFFQAEARRSCAAVWGTFSEGCLRELKGAEECACPWRGRTPHTQGLFCDKPRPWAWQVGTSLPLSPPPQAQWPPAAIQTSQVHVLLLAFANTVLTPLEHCQVVISLLPSPSSGLCSNVTVSVRPPLTTLFKISPPQPSTPFPVLFFSIASIPI